MTNIEQDNEDIEIETTDTEAENIIEDEPELVDMEATAKDKLKKLRDDLKRCEAEKMEVLEESQRAKADFLNARRRLEEERIRDRVRYKKQHVMELLPLCDSFQMAMSDKDAWEKADKNWRMGVEGINTQLMGILSSYNVTTLNPLGQPFDPNKHEAIGTEEVDEASQADTVIKVVQMGYEMKDGDQTEIIRPARVTTGTAK